MGINEDLESISEDDLLEILDDIEIPSEISHQNKTSDNAKVDDITSKIQNTSNNSLDNITINDNISDTNNKIENKTVEINSSNCDKVLDILKELLSKKRIDITIRVRS